MSQPKRHRAESDSESSSSEEAKNEAGRTNSTPQRKTIDEGVTSTQPQEPEQETVPPRVLKNMRMDILDLVTMMEDHRISRADLDDFVSLVFLLRAHKEANNIHLSNAYRELKSKFMGLAKTNQ